MHSVFDSHTERLFRAILTLTSVEECERFFADAFTVKELHDIAQRYEVAELLSKGRVYTDIATETGASTATISRVNKCLQYGDGGYRIAIERLKEKEEEKE